MKFIWHLASRMFIMMGMFLSSASSVMFVVIVNKDGITNTQLFLCGWMLISSSIGVSLYLEWMAKDAKKKDKEWQIDKKKREEKKEVYNVIKEAEQIAKGNN